MRTRLKYLCDVGLGYLTLDRQSRTLSGGEVQRINLTTALGTSLVNTLFVLDEPSIGLHPRDPEPHRRGHAPPARRRQHPGGGRARSVGDAGRRPPDRHGPGPGERGGTIVFDGTPGQIRGVATLTGDYLGGRRRVADATHWQRRPVADDTPRIVLEVPANTICRTSPYRSRCTGVRDRGVGLRQVDAAAGRALPGHGAPLRQGHRSARRLPRCPAPAGQRRGLRRPVADRQTARSNPASYVGAFDEIRKLFAKAPVALQRGYTAGTFSFNSGDGRCPTCGGSGFEHVEMQFLSDVYLRCPDCDGTRYRAECWRSRSSAAAPTGGRAC